MLPTFAPFHDGDDLSGVLEYAIYDQGSHTHSSQLTRQVDSAPYRNRDREGGNHQDNSDDHRKENHLIFMKMFLIRQ